MIRNITLLLLLFFSITGYSQDFSTLWEGHFSYYDIKDVSQSTTKIYAASENAIFSYDLTTNEIQTITTVDGLSGETIITIHYSEDYQLLMIGYLNGLIEIYFESDNSILSVVDILEKETVPPNKKKINHFNESDGFIYISTDYGISVYDLQRLEFGDSYFIGNGGSQISVKQTTIFGDFIYAACGDNNAVKKANLSDPNLIDYQQWQTLDNGSFISIENVDDKLYAIKSNNVIYEIISDNFNTVSTYGQTPVDMRSYDGNLIVTTQSNVFVYGSNFNVISSVSTNAEYNTQYTCATISNNQIYIGTRTFGVLKTEVSNPQEFIVIRPNGPLRNDTFKVSANNGNVFATYGDYDVFLNAYPLQTYGISRLVEEEWVNIPYDSVFGATNLNEIAFNPFNPSQVFVSSFFDGILELNNGIPTTLYDENNSGLESLDVGDPTYIDIRVGGLVFDRSGLLWSMTSLANRPLKSYNPGTGQWQAYSFEDLIPNPVQDESGYGNDLVIDNNGTKWTTSMRNGVIAYNENNGDQNIGRLYTQDQNMPDVQVRSLAIDNRNQLWIGTFRGLRVLYNTSNFLNDPNPRASEIVIVEEGVPKELLALQFITDIKVDGSNNKWIGTDDSGVFYFSPDGQETIYHFTTDNSPLPSNQIRDISIDAQTGKVFIATSKGLVAFSSGGSKPNDELNNAFVYPNPVRPEYNLLGSSDLNDITNGVKIKGLTENVNIKITDIEGNLVAEAQSRVNLRSSRAGYNFAIDGGTAIWNGRNLGNNIVASGVYLILINDLDSFETKILKLLIIR
ncbi:ABC transporter substrate-binding protein [Subsaxibacter sp. CAU 1640]|uniref:type IX secretion system anionic LPS delivery protein PorZ n=1 Tax=Subsaxibacter sp. CAU 1640 TaxID=2933271 RepID=UPI002005A866|nr:two-component regulator propeller domain-containing protein [Subsaxibacter sp. CAU 1640]MCK7589695.1 ABC transporter substrate-binding protein [Subsaxibacter sp. CAU 1640]